MNEDQSKTQSARTQAELGSLGDALNSTGSLFGGLLYALNATAQQYLGGAETSKVDLPLAQANIDIIAMLQEKTKGNLEAAEETLLSEVLTGLRVRYARVANKKTADTSSDSAL